MWVLHNDHGHIVAGHGKGVDTIEAFESKASIRRKETDDEKRSEKQTRKTCKRDSFSFRKREENEKRKQKRHFHSFKTIGNWLLFNIKMVKTWWLNLFTHIKLYMLVCIQLTLVKKVLLIRSPNVVAWRWFCWWLLLLTIFWLLLTQQVVNTLRQWIVVVVIIVMMKEVVMMLMMVMINCGWKERRDIILMIWKGWRGKKRIQVSTCSSWNGIWRRTWRRWIGRRWWWR